MQRDSVQIIVGAQWGDEGKGKWIDVLAKDVELVVRYQGGNNAGHTLYHNDKKIVLHHLPSGILHKTQTCVLGAGMVVNPIALRRELTTIKEVIDVDVKRLWISARAHVITPWHIHQDARHEQASTSPIGTTKRGIGPTYSAKAWRNGLRLGQYVDPDALARWTANLAEMDAQFRAYLQNFKEDWQAFVDSAEELRPFVFDVEHRLREEIKHGKKVILEGAQGALLDIDHGTYPYVTSSSTTAAGACQSLGLNPRAIDRIVGIAKAYVTRVGEGPFPTELQDEVGKHLAEKGNEFGASTGRPRRCGWLDGVALKYSVEVNGLDAVVLNKMDILNGLPEIKMAVAYQHPTLGTLREFPWNAEVLAACQPIYETFPGWKGDIPETGSFADLQPEARDYIEAVEAFCGTRILMVGTGPKREQALYR